MKLLNSLTYLFKPEQHFENAEAIVLASKLNLLRGICLILFLTSVSSLITRMFMYETPLFNLVSLGLICLALLAFLLYFLRVSKINWVTNAFMVFYFLATTLRIAQGGGVYSINIFIYILFCACGFTLFGRKAGFFFSTICFTSIVGFFALQMTNPEILNNKHLPLATQGAFVLVVFLYNILPLSFIFQAKDELAKKVKDYEKKQSSTIIMRRLTHEVGNALNIATGHLDISKEAIPENSYLAITEQLDRIDKVMKSLDAKAGEGKLIDFLEEHEGHPQILKRDK